METARVMAKRGVHAVIGARNIGAAENAKAEILRQNTNARVTLLHLDLSSVKSIRAFVRDFHALHLPLNLLMYFLSLSLSDTLLIDFGPQFFLTFRSLILRHSGPEWHPH